MNNLISIMTMYGYSPCHVGSGSALGVIDSPIQRERHTNWPVIPASGMKGALRASFSKRLEEKDDSLVNTIFGTSNTSEDNSGFAGSFSISDAKLLAFPMRSSVVPFAAVTSPAILLRYARDLRMCNVIIDDFEITLQEEEAFFFFNTKDTTKDILLEDYVVKAQPLPEELSSKLKKLLPNDYKNLLIVSDVVFDYCVSNCLPITASIKIDQQTGTTSNGSLRYQEDVPSDTLFYFVIVWGNSFGSNDMMAATIKDNVLKTVGEYLQVGGDDSLGHGVFKLVEKEL